MISEKKFRKQARPMLPFLEQALDDLHCPHDTRGEELLDLLVNLFRIVVVEGSPVAECGMVRLESTTEPGEATAFEVSVVTTIGFFQEGELPFFHLYPSYDSGSVCPECGQIKKEDE